MQIMDSQICLQKFRHLERQTSFHATVSEKVNRWLVPERTYVSIAALKPLEERDFLKSDRD